MDNGMTWSAVKKTELPNPNSAIDAVRLRDGRLVMVYNDTTDGRTPLSLAWSKNGETWTKLRDLETGPGEYSYPAMIQARNGDLVISYTWKRQKIRVIRLALSEIH
jgi:predicted neuraminidase